MATVENELAPLMRRAFSAAVGAVLVLDARMRVVLATDSAEKLIGQKVSLGMPAAKLLCRNSPKRELAEALTQGRSIDVVIPHPRDAAMQRTLRVRSITLRDGRTVAGFLLLVDEGFGAGSDPTSFHGMWSQNPKMREMFRMIERVAHEDVTVLVRGETGTGKELVAQAIHALSSRSTGPFRAINCAALPATLLESELFGHVRGAFTGAVRDAPGHFQLAHRGTLFLDEVGEMPLEVQAKLLRVLETRSVLAVGAMKAVPVDVRILSATHRSLRKEVEAGRFRADLMYRLRVIPVFLPALRERREDIALLCGKLIESFNQTRRRRIERLAPAALSVLERHDWPGNIRELQNVLAYAYTMGEGPILELRDLPPELVEQASPGIRQPSAAGELEPELQRILAVLARTNGNKNRAAQILGMSRVTLWRRLRELGHED